MRVRILTLPYECGHHDVSMGRGPAALLAAGLTDALEAAGHEVELEPVHAGGDGAPLGETQRAFDLLTALALATRGAVGDRRLPLVLSGPCYGAVAVLAGIGVRGTGVVWLDAHADFNTPETTRTGYLDGMGVSMLAGRCWSEMVAAIPGHEPLPIERFLWLGLRDLDPGEEAQLERLRAARLGPTASAEQMRTAIDALAGSVESFYLHLDPDVVDLQDGCGNELAGFGGMRATALADAVDAVCSARPLAALGFASYDPGCDADGRIARLAIDCLVRAVDAQSGS